MPRPVAQTSSGALRGAREEGLDVFRGVPYAAPPLGRRRWRRPEPVEPWTGERDATTFGPIPPQDVSPERLATRGLVMSEDCLTLNVWTPGADDARRPVLVFLHGGGVVMGHAAAPLLAGGRLAARGDVVVVTVGFRLGALGSVYAPERLGGASTNLALRDQLAALRWVRDEIGAFGGDPANVTVAGQSSGAVAIACMLATEAASGLFDKAILQSGGLERVRATEAAADVARQLFDALPDVDDQRDLTVDELLAAQGRIPTGFVPPEGPWHHCIDGDLVPEHPLVVAASHPLLPVPLLVGATRDEWRAFDAAVPDAELTDAYVRERARALAGPDADVDDVLARYRAAHPADDPQQQRRAVASALVTDYHFVATSEQLARHHASHGGTAFRYELQWESPRPGLGACHDVDLPLVFGTYDRVPVLAGDGPDTARMSEIVQDAWLAFLRTGDPSTDALGAWPAYDADRRPTMLLGPDPHVVDRHRNRQLEVWDGRYPSYP